MTAVVLDAVSWLLLGVGAFFTLVGAVGMLRLPDVFARMHAAGMTDTMGAGLILAGLCFQAGDVPVVARLLLVGAFLWFTSPISTHALARAALHTGVRPLAGTATPADGGRSTNGPGVPPAGAPGVGSRESPGAQGVEGGAASKP